MIAIMWVGIQKWVYDEENDPEENGTELPYGSDVNKEQCFLLKQAFQKQNKIGWEHFITGRITKAWSTYYAYGLTDDEEKDGKVMVFARDVVRATWQFTLAVWTSHNEKVHGKKNKYSIRDVQSLQKHITFIYNNLKFHISQEDQWLFREAEKIRCEQPVPQMMGWLERALLSLEEVPEAEEMDIRAKRLINKMSVS